MDQGPVLIVTFNAQQIMAVMDSKGKVVEGDAVSIKFIVHVVNYYIMVLIVPILH